MKNSSTYVARPGISTVRPAYVAAPADKAIARIIPGTYADGNITIRSSIKGHNEQVLEVIYTSKAALCFQKTGPGYVMLPVNQGYATQAFHAAQIRQVVVAMKAAEMLDFLGKKAVRKAKATIPAPVAAASNVIPLVQPVQAQVQAATEIDPTGLRLAGGHMCVIDDPENGAQFRVWMSMQALHHFGKPCGPQGAIRYYPISMARAIATVTKALTEANLGQYPGHAETRKLAAAAQAKAPVSKAA